MRRRLLPALAAVAAAGALAPAVLAAAHLPAGTPGTTSERPTPCAQTEAVQRYQASLSNRGAPVATTPPRACWPEVHDEISARAMAARAREGGARQP